MIYHIFMPHKLLKPVRISIFFEIIYYIVNKLSQFALSFLRGLCFYYFNISLNVVNVVSVKVLLLSRVSNTFLSPDTK